MMELRCIRGYQSRRVTAFEGDVFEFDEAEARGLLEAAPECFEVVAASVEDEGEPDEAKTPKKKGRK